ncbi:Nicastrin isoform 1 [Schistosoma japonicum]|uniref:Nicastrin n=1 Tax=Schistosoma japonicum TaxID=6182 RepID=A0A4Z2CZX9_SCHJA|nr:Nicastrin [Schistosoma japonicum]KAH8853351.1 Nicastrin [Schistosoma japonicum]TNN09825.1 Nicastrin isoform 1 [Schistosoma japonicum]
MVAVHWLLQILSSLIINIDPLHCSKITNHIYNYIPLSYTSFCTRRLNLTGQVGCSSSTTGNSGVALFMNESEDIMQTLHSDTSTPFVILVSVKHFTNASLMRFFMSTRNVKGLIVFSNEDVNDDNHEFSESSKCPNGLYSAYNVTKQCDLDIQWNPAGTDYSYIDWPFPVVLVADVNNTIRASMYECFSVLNKEPYDDTRCSIEIYNPMSAAGSSETCFRRQYLMTLHISESSGIFCDELTGLNIILSASDSVNHSWNNIAVNIGTSGRSENSSVFILTRMDSRSIFERSGFSSQGVLPSVAVLISVAAHLMRQKAFKDSHLEKDLFFGFLDNEAYDFMGSYRLSYDLGSGNIARYTGRPVMWNNVHAVIELGEVGLSQKHNNLHTFYMLTDSKSYNLTRDFTDNIFHQLTAASKASQKVDLQRPSDKLQELPLPPTSSMQTLLQTSARPLSHVVLSDHDRPPFRNKHFESFMDTKWPPTDNPTADITLLDLANTLADALHRIVSANHTSIPSGITYPKPGDIMECFVTNLGCDLFKMVIFLNSLSSLLFALFLSDF